MKIQTPGVYIGSRMSIPYPNPESRPAVIVSGSGLTEPKLALSYSDVVELLGEDEARTLYRIFRDGALLMECG